MVAVAVAPAEKEGVIVSAEGIARPWAATAGSPAPSSAVLPVPTTAAADSGGLGDEEVSKVLAWANC